ncbi:hypothetical protein TNCV_2311611 [Trichonephila clavipes]|nr:hypothetical protein TNCV_2311611 [Trichonephila clavipes]
MKLNVSYLSRGEMNWVNFWICTELCLNQGETLLPSSNTIYPGDNHHVSMPSKISMYRNTGAPSSPLPFSQSTSAKSNYARDCLSSSPSLLGSSLPNSSSKMNRPVPLGIPY